jgi:hypothetical protein
MKKLYFALLSLCLFSACQPSKKNSETTQVIQTSHADALAPYLTEDNQGRAVLCWTEKNLPDSTNMLKYAYFDDQANGFGAPVAVPSSKGMSTTAESMGKVAFKADGTAIAFFSRRFEQEKNPFAGAIYYSLSGDKGKSWTTQQFLHSDTSHAYGRSFFDVTSLKDGQVAAVWLDGRYGKTIKGSALYFARTGPGGGFEQDTCLEKGTCECCRTDLLKDPAGNLHVAYRSISFPLETNGKQVRDMVYQQSQDNGKTFSKPEAVSKDNWAIEACPHSGPTLAVNKEGVNAVWFTAGGTPGLYAASSAKGTAAFRARNLVTPKGRHPQMLALANGDLVMVCEEASEESAAMPAMKMQHGHGGMQMSHGPAAPAAIVLRVMRKGSTWKQMPLSKGDFGDNHAVIKVVPDGVLVAWVREDQGHSSICYTKVNTSGLER